MTRKTKLYIEQKKINWKAVSETLSVFLGFMCCFVAIYVSVISEKIIMVIATSFLAGVVFVIVIACIYDSKFTKTVKIYVKKEVDAK
ncbi:MAG: hypothetical protein ACP6IP_10830 [Candidatus Njordarchaeia archaeon]